MTGYFELKDLRCGGLGKRKKKDFIDPAIKNTLKSKRRVWGLNIIWRPAKPSVCLSEEDNLEGRRAGI
jgi:hypothetical protein